MDGEISNFKEEESAMFIQRLSARQTKDVDVMALRECEGNVRSLKPKLILNSRSSSRS
jgi:hypothetical protein